MLQLNNPGFEPLQNLFILLSFTAIYQQPSSSAPCLHIPTLLHIIPPSLPSILTYLTTTNTTCLHTFTTYYCILPPTYSSIVQPHLINMCHTVIAQRMCKDCRHSLGETVIDFTRCARKCSSPFYCLTPEPQMELCNLCTATATLSTPVLAQHALEDTTTAAAAAAYPGPGVARHTAAH